MAIKRSHSTVEDDTNNHERETKAARIHEPAPTPNFSGKRKHDGGDDSTQQPHTKKARGDATLPPTTTNKPKSKKAAWKQRRREKLAAKPTSTFFTKLPGEIRNKIYEYVFTPAPLIKLVKARNHVRDESTTNDEDDSQRTIVRCGRLMGKYTRQAGTTTNWTSSISGIILANKQAYREATGYMYAACTFESGAQHLAQAFFRVVSKPNLARIKHVRYWHEFPMPGTEYEDQATKLRLKSDLTAQKLCGLIAVRGKNAEMLEVRLTGDVQFNAIVPSDRALRKGITAEDLKKRALMRVIQPFQNMKKLASARVSLGVAKRVNLEQKAIRELGPQVAAQFTRDQIAQIATTWAKWVEGLHESYGNAIAESILAGKDGGGGVWDGHLGMLDGYHGWLHDPLAEYEKYLPENE